MIRHKNYFAAISDEGAELKSFRDETRGEEFIWQGDPAIWQGSAPILFPIVGRLKGGYFLHGGRKYRLEKHGFARRSLFALRRDREEEKSFLLRSSRETLSLFPFDFEFEAGFRIEEGLLRIFYTVRNTGREVMYFTLGSHPAFALPLDECRLEDYYVEFEKEEKLDRCFLEGDLLCTRPEPFFLDGKNRIPLTDDLFDRDALIFRNIRSRKITLGNRKSGRRLLLETGGAPHLGIWAKPAASYVCLEPWFGHDDSADSGYAITGKSGIMPLDPGAEFETGYGIRV